MKPNECFTRAVMALPGLVRERLDADDPLDWNLLEDAGTGALLRDAARAYRRLPEPVELLVRRLIQEVGIMPADVAAGVEREGTARAWIHQIAIEPEGESYRIHDGRIGEIHAPVRPEAIAGYATLALELAASIHDAVERWIEAGARPQTAAEASRATSRSVRPRCARGCGQTCPLDGTQAHRAGRRRFSPTLWNWFGMLRASRRARHCQPSGSVPGEARVRRRKTITRR